MDIPHEMKELDDDLQGLMLEQYELTKKIAELGQKVMELKKELIKSA